SRGGGADRVRQSWERQDGAAVAFYWHPCGASASPTKRGQQKWAPVLRPTALLVINGAQYRSGVYPRSAINITPKSANRYPLSLIARAVPVPMCCISRSSRAIHPRQSGKDR